MLHSIYKFYKKSQECSKFWEIITKYDDNLAYLVSDNLLSLAEIESVYKEIGYTRSDFFINENIYPRNAGSVYTFEELQKKLYSGYITI